MIRHILDKIIPSRRRRWWIGCSDAFPVLSEFMDKELDEDLMAKMQRHLEDCPPCQNLFNSLEKTKDLCRQTPDREVPQDLAQDLMGRIRKEYEEAKRHLEETD
jgi:anti-sigma factor (TIGR02949 family)